jgi:hypothetical protein
LLIDKQLLANENWRIAKVLEKVDGPWLTSSRCVFSNFRRAVLLVAKQHFTDKQTAFATDFRAALGTRGGETAIQTVGEGLVTPRRRGAFGLAGI